MQKLIYQDAEQLPFLAEATSVLVSVQREMLNAVCSQALAVRAGSCTHTFTGITKSKALAEMTGPFIELCPHLDT